MVLVLGELVELELMIALDSCLTSSQLPTFWNELSIRMILSSSTFGKESRWDRLGS